VQCNPQLLQLVFALRPTGRLSSLLDGREQQGHEYGDDRDDHQQFNERKRRPGRFPSLELTHRPFL
jgi:hypothetical protein